MLERLHLSGRILCHMEGLEKSLSAEIDYTATNAIIRVERAKTMSYLRRNLLHSFEGSEK